MTEIANPPLSAWESFYVIVGSSGAALIGLQFVVMALMSGLRRRMSIETINAFGTPTVVHLVGALVVSAIMSAPWPSPAAAGVALALCGVAGLAYGALVIRLTGIQTGYAPVLSDWLWYAILPCGLYALLTLACLFLRASAGVALFVIAAATLGLLLIGIRNSWDAITHMIVFGSQDGERKDEETKKQ